MCIRDRNGCNFLLAINSEIEDLLLVYLWGNTWGYVSSHCLESTSLCLHLLTYGLKLCNQSIKSCTMYCNFRQVSKTKGKKNLEFDSWRHIIWFLTSHQRFILSVPHIILARSSVFRAYHQIYHFILLNIVTIDWYISNLVVQEAFTFNTRRKSRTYF